MLVSNHSGSYEVAFVWNRSIDKMEDMVPQQLVLLDLSNAASMSPDLIVEVAHPSIIADYGKLFLQIADFMVTYKLQKCKFPVAKLLVFTVALALGVIQHVATSTSYYFFLSDWFSHCTG